MITEQERREASIGGVFLYAIARLLFIRVTEWWRPMDADYGSETSLHKSGGAIDFGKETPGWKVSIIRFFCAGRTEDGFHEVGTAPHYHFTASMKTVILGITTIMIIHKMIIKPWSRGRRMF